MFKPSFERTYGSEQSEREKLGSATMLGCCEDDARPLTEAFGIAMVRPEALRDGAMERADEGDIMIERS